MKSRIAPDWRNTSLTIAADRLPAVRDWYNRRATRGRADTWFRYCLSLVERERLGSAHMLSLGCNTGELERSLCKLQTFAQCDGIDALPESISAAQSSANAEGYGNLVYAVGDLNEVGLKRSTYDAVWLNMTVGGVSNLEHLIEQIARSLKPGGLLFANEYVGTRRFALRQHQRELVRAAFSLVPQRFRQAEELALPGPHGVEDAWGLRTDEVVAVLLNHFEFDEFNPICGSLLHFILNPIVVDRLAEDLNVADHVLDMLFRIEECLVDCGEVATDYALIVARPKRL